MIGLFLPDDNSQLYQKPYHWMTEEEWLRQNQADFSNTQTDYPAKRYVEPANYCPDWYEDKNEYTQAWQDFLEELDNRGITLDDPEAAEIWETFH